MADVFERLKAALSDRYTIERELGSGGMATVYLAEDLKHRRKVAVKVLRPELAAALGPKRFLQEIGIAASLSHPHILPLHDSGEAGGFLFYVMPYVDGESLRDRLNRERQLPVVDALKIAREVADGLGSAHRHGVVHRDIKPENILLSESHALIADFGIARAIDVAGGSKLTETGIAVGTPLYMSPEQASAEHDIDGRSDLYALGCVLQEMLVGQPPFTGATAQSIIRQHLTDAPEPVSKLRPSLTGSIVEVVEKSLAKSPGDRFESGSEFAVALGKAVPQPAASLTAPRRRSAARMAGWATILIIALWGVFSLAWLLYSGWVEQRIAELELQIRELTDRREYEAAFALAAQSLPYDDRFDELRDAFSVSVSLFRTDPGGAVVSRRPYDSPVAWDRLGTTPVSDVSVPRGISVMRFELEGRETIEMVLAPQSKDTVELYLPAQGEVPPGMVRVPAGPTSIPNYSGTNMELESFLIDRHEVTNREFKEFIDAGGYIDPAFWLDAMMRGESFVDWAAAIEVFVDRTGLPGPATWEAGDFADGEADLPVQGVSWFEAQAYAVYREKELPTAFHWHRAAQTHLASYIVPMSNFGDEGPVATGTTHSLSGWGTYDMAGNVREWVTNASGTERFILGGAWSDFTYLFPTAYAVDPWNRSPGNGFRLASYGERTDLTEASRSLDLPYRDYNVEQPVSDETFEAFRSSYAYDPDPLNATLGEREVAEDWIVERVVFDAAYGDEQVIADLYLPRNGNAPYQAVIYMSGSGSITSGRTLDDVRHQLPLDFVLKTGRAVVLPAYEGSLDRRRSDLVTSRDFETYAHAEYMARWVKDLRRSIDYLETREDIDSERIGYYGSSWGGRVGPIMLAMEPRLKVGVLVLAGFRPEKALPVADVLNFVPRVRQPVVMINGREDHLRPYELSQIPFFRLLGTAPEHKEHLVFPGGHFVPRADLIRETLRWLDQYLGPVGEP